MHVRDHLTGMGALAIAAFVFDLPLWGVALLALVGGFWFNRALRSYR